MRTQKHICEETVEGFIFSVMAKRVGIRKELPDCYFEGFLEKRSIRDKKPRKLYTCLCGSALYFFNEKRDTDYIEKVDLCGFISITDDRSIDQNLDAARLNLQMKDGNVKLTAPNAESRELWKGFIHSVAELSLPPSLNLLPGQIHMLKEVVEKEKKRIKGLPSPPAVDCSSYVTPNADMPACYYKVSRLEAEMLLEREAEKGNLLLRPGSDGTSFSVSTRQDYRGSMFRHYRVSRKPTGGFIIEVENPVHCATLHDVVSILVDQTNGVMIPLILENTYEKIIAEFVRSDNENGEKTLQNLVQPSLPPKPAPVKHILPRTLYLNDTVMKNQTETDNSSASSQPVKMQNKVTKAAIMPPAIVPRKPTASVISSTNPNQRSKTQISWDSQKMSSNTMTELKQVFEKKLKSQEGPD
ncbi:signal-transducing adaptor protein 1-like isoform X3 [Gouania willdenowi]|uniref:signal-transducing adaptor protein 1-like isoform X3 n=1 Tax=Gouania willdenowi TaxID=441366 RepID=UPI00105492E8|nr:signal-transducing adaptor protein 1-like isoform X3 [Gouania willdenowi]